LQYNADDDFHKSISGSTNHLTGKQGLENFGVQQNAHQAE
jgi:hypothetical protein